MTKWFETKVPFEVSKKLFNIANLLVQQGNFDVALLNYGSYEDSSGLHTQYLSEALEAIVRHFIAPYSPKQIPPPKLFGRDVTEENRLQEMLR